MPPGNALRLRLLRILSIAACRLRMRRRLPPVPRRRSIRGDRIPGPKRAPGDARAWSGVRKFQRRRERCLRAPRDAWVKSRKQGVTNMNFEAAGRHARRKPNGSDAELDALVIREVEALAARRRAPAGKRRAADDDPALAAASEPDERPDQGDIAPNNPRARRPESPGERQAGSRESNIVGLRHAESERTEALFSADEEKFIEQALAFLKGRENADAVIEELWTHAVLDRDEGIDAQLDEAMRAADVAQSDDEPDFIDDRLLAEDEEAGAQPPDRITPLRADRPANERAAPSRPAPPDAEAKPPKPERPKPKSTGGSGKRGPTE
jgi:hypothetical protein